jgi:2'-5' RNA ligase
MPRLFTGLEIPPEIARQLAALRGGLPGARWMEPSDYHITLRFLGDVDGRTAREVTHYLDDIAGQPIPLALDGLESFGGDKPRSVFAKARLHPALVSLQADHERLMRQCGLAPEARKFRPHVTLARLRDASAIDVARYLAGSAIISPLTFVASRFVLFSSRDSVGGGPYVVEAAYPLR